MINAKGTVVVMDTEKTPGRVIVRFAREEDLERVNELRRQVNDLHVAGRPDVFKPGFCDELRDYLYAIWKSPEQKIVVAEAGGTVCGFAVLNHIVRPENPFMFVRDYLDIDEFCVDKAFRRRGGNGRPRDAPSPRVAGAHGRDGGILLPRRSDGQALPPLPSLAPVGL